jgi:hypothetical protein
MGTSSSAHAAPSRAVRVGQAARYALAAIRVINGGLAVIAPSAIAAVPTRMAEDVALIGPWAKIADEIQRWKQTVLTTFSVSCDLRALPRVADLVRC